MWFTKANNKGKPRPNEALKTPTLHIEHMNSQQNNTNSDFPASMYEYP